jgi:acyl-CoA synthetase (AMP-forming)/AMP-acid ligase II
LRRNGDLALLRDGYLHGVGRIKDITIVGGSNVYTSDVEAVLDGCAKIREAAVVGRPRRRTRRVARRMRCAPPRRSLTAEQVSGLYEPGSWTDPTEPFSSLNTNPLVELTTST